MFQISITTRSENNTCTLSFQEYFKAFHKDKNYVRKFLKPLYLGEVEGYTENELLIDYTALIEKANDMVKAMSYELLIDYTALIEKANDMVKVKSER